MALRAGSTWREIPECYGTRQTCYERYKRWTEDGRWPRALTEAQASEDPTPPQDTLLPPAHATHSPQRPQTPSDNPLKPAAIPHKTQSRHLIRSPRTAHLRHSVSIKIRIHSHN
ncbi:transposase [Nonomuraea sp. NPDC005692]|uniref:transposase n=1 Tax=Nonomuraea sp. NPDC005692 TaxID=3157168 RepID=UPI0033E5BDDF